MAPLPQNNTPRLFVKWEGPEGPRETVFRYLTADGIDAAVALARTLCTAVASNVQPDVAAVQVRVQSEGSNVSFPATWGAPIPGTGPNRGRSYGPAFISFTGRSIDGRRSRLTFPYAAIDLDATVLDNFRLAPAESSAVTDVLVALNTSLIDLRSVSGLPVLWNGYANYGVNAYYQRKQRRS